MRSASTAQLVKFAASPTVYMVLLTEMHAKGFLVHDERSANESNPVKAIDKNFIVRMF